MAEQEDIFYACASDDVCEYKRDTDMQCMDIGWCTEQRPIKKKQEPPNDKWCVGRSPDNCSGCGT